jgi:cobalt/nickel transport system permease protein
LPYSDAAKTAGKIFYEEHCDYLQKGGNMHIPDGYLSPQTCAVLYGAAVPFWAMALRRVKAFLGTRTVPVLALFSAFAFVVQMFNIPLPGGTTGHAVGGTLIAIILGPWAAVLGITVVLAIQALLFGDGGITALGANVFNMAIALPLTGYWIYRLIAGRAPTISPRHLWGAFIGSYIGIQVGAFLTALWLGLQPAFFHAPDGAPLYCPYGLSQAIPAMMIGHLFIAGPAEGLITAGAIAYLRKSHPSLLQLNRAALPSFNLRWLWLGLAIIALLTPLGLLAAGTAWGEWGTGELKDVIGYVPEGLERLEGLWSSPMPDYSLPFTGEMTGYILAAVAGIGLVVLTIWGTSRGLVGRK